MWRTEDPLPRRRSWGAQVLLIEAQPVDGVRPKTVQIITFSPISPLKPNTSRIIHVNTDDISGIQKKSIFISSKSYVLLEELCMLAQVCNPSTQGLLQSPGSPSILPIGLRLLVEVGVDQYSRLPAPGSRLPAPGIVDAAGRPDVRVRTLPAPASARIAG
ncbi:hypothetical protein STEG23_023921 [Scotinomys teguina]